MPPTGPGPPSTTQSGQKVEERLPGSVTRTSAYDNLGRLTGETGTGATTTARALDYDPLGRITSATSPAGNLSYTWTDRGLLSTATGYGGTATYTYDGEAHLTNRTDSAGAVTFGYDSSGRLSTVADPLTATTATTSYDDAGRPSTVSYGSGKATRAYTYDNLGRLATDSWKRPDATVAASAVVTYDNDDLTLTRTTTGGSSPGANTYTYDGLRRLSTWTDPSSQLSTYGYDGASNRTTVTTTAGTRTSTYDARDRLIAADGAGQPAVTYTFTARGTLATAVNSSQTTTYTFDSFERLTQKQTPGYTVSYAYDSLDRAAQRNGVSFGYADLSNDPIISPTSAGNSTILRDPSGRPLASKIGTNAATTLLADRVHADVTAAADPSTGTVSASASVDPWGQPLASSGTLPLGYQGGWTDFTTGQVNAHSRWYDPTTGSFDSRDTLTLNPDPIAQANGYLYGNASPLNQADPSGHCPWCAFAGLGGLMAGEAAIPVAGWIALGITVVVAGIYVCVQLCGGSDSSSSSSYSGDSSGPVTASNVGAGMTAAYAGYYASQYAASQLANNTAGAGTKGGGSTKVGGGGKSGGGSTARGGSTTRGGNGGGSGGNSGSGASGRPGFQQPPHVQQLAIPAMAAPVVAAAQVVNAQATGAAASLVNAVAAAGISLGETGSPGNGDDRCSTDPKDIIAAVAQEVVDEMGLPGLDATFSERQTGAVSQKDWLKWYYRGSEVHDETARRLQGRFGDRFTYRRVGVDFLDNATQRLIELTTKPREKQHRDKGGDYETCDYAFYKFPSER